MLKVILVDDEKIEREGIAALIDWEKHGFQLLGAAKNGVEALDWIPNLQPDIVITDIKMPVISGIDLIRKASALNPKILFAVLSGYGDYEYTSRAMLLGVRHYLLKPIDEKKMLDMLYGMKEEIGKRSFQDQTVDKLAGSLEKVLPHAKAQFLRGCVQSSIYGTQDYAYFKSLFGITADRFVLSVFHFEEECDFVDKYALENIAEEVIGWKAVQLNCIVEQNVVLLTETEDVSGMEETMRKVHREYSRYFQKLFSMAVSDEGRFDEIPQMYRQAVRFLKYRFEFPDSTVLCSRAFYSSAWHSDLSLDIDILCGLARNGKMDEMNVWLECFFNRLDREDFSDFQARSYCRKLCRNASAIFASRDGKQEVDRCPDLDRVESRRELYHTVRVVLNEACGRSGVFELEQQKSPVIKSAVKCIYENIGNPELSLQWLARNVLFMNEEYLGRIFQKEMNEKFSKFVMRTRIEIAKKLLRNFPDLHVREVASMTGFAEDSQYFGHVFKNDTGQTPLAYRKQWKGNASGG